MLAGVIVSKLSRPKLTVTYISSHNALFLLYVMVELGSSGSIALKRPAWEAIFTHKLLGFLLTELHKFVFTCKVAKETGA